MVGGKLPVFGGIRLAESEVQCRLAPIKIPHKISVAVSVALNESIGKFTCFLLSIRCQSRHTNWYICSVSLCMIRRTMDDR